MDNAAAAVTKLFGKGSTTTADAEQTSSKSSTAATTKPDTVDATVDAQVNPAVEHTHVKKAHETREQTFVEKEKHQDHYHTTIQPLKDTEVVPEKHDYTSVQKERVVNKDDGSAKAKAENDTAGHVHHHLHETVQPVIDKEVIVPSVTHKKVDVHEKIQEQSKHHGVTTNSSMSVDEFQKKLDKAEK
ncbi:hypothetical protein BKA61DRAFT_636074 [Leptodontidium sp. MPI-SDFR-AT-0119]|nr:hypothetical protein BKA61DRAFT_636074 [Leptodontidium sp. MPI-SDFR-AT-0119]